MEPRSEMVADVSVQKLFSGGETIGGTARQNKEESSAQKIQAKKSKLQWQCPYCCITYCISSPTTDRLLLSLVKSNTSQRSYILR